MVSSKQEIFKHAIDFFCTFFGYLKEVSGTLYVHWVKQNYEVARKTPLSSSNLPVNYLIDLYD